MNKILNFRSFLAVVTVLFVLSGCEKAPQAEIDAAKAALDSAKTAQADVYAAAEYNALQDSLNSVMVKVEEQNSKTFPSYSALKEQLQAIPALSAQAITAAQANKAQLKAEAIAALQEVKTILDSDKELLTKAPKGKEGAAALEEIKQEIELIETSLNEVNATIETANYVEAKDKVNAMKEKASAINTELTEAIAKTSRRI